MDRNRYILLTVLTVVAGILLTLGLAIAQETGQKIAMNAFPSVVSLVMRGPSDQPVSLGSGFVIHPGIVATNLHVIEGSVKGYARITGQPEKHKIEGIVAIDYRRELALLSVPDIEAHPLLLGDSSKVVVGGEVYAIGNPLGDSGNIVLGDDIYTTRVQQGSEGISSQGAVSHIHSIGSDSLLQITALISPGSNGGPVLNSQGEVIGVAISLFKGGQNLNFAIPVSYVAKLLSMERQLVLLSGKKRLGNEESILESLGSRSTDGVKGDAFMWTQDTYLSDLIGAPYSFSLQNRLNQSVKNIYCLVIFYNRNEKPVGFGTAICREAIAPGHEKRLKSKVQGKIQKLTTASQSSQVPLTKVKFRILDFQIMP